jgi:hypothetical protein
LEIGFFGPVGEAAPATLSRLDLGPGAVLEIRTGFPKPDKRPLSLFLVRDSGGGEPYLTDRGSAMSWLAAMKDRLQVRPDLLDRVSADLKAYGARPEKGEIRMGELRDDPREQLVEFALACLRVYDLVYALPLKSRACVTG